MVSGVVQADESVEYSDQRPKAFAMGIGRVHCGSFLSEERLWHATHPGLFKGLGFLSFISIVIVEIFGSPFMRNCSVVMGLIIGSSSPLACVHWPDTS